MSFVFSFQILTIIMLLLIILFQRSSGDGVMTSSNDIKRSVNSPEPLVRKFTILLIFIFMVNSIILARNYVQNSYSDVINESINDEDKTGGQDTNEISKLE